MAAKGAKIRVFIQHVDSYTGRNVGETILQVLNRPPEDEEEEFDDEEGKRRKPRKPVESKVDIIGTLSSPDAKMPSWCSEVVPEEQSDEFAAALLSCDFIVYNILAGSIDDTVYAVQIAAGGEYSGKKAFILLSTVMTWVRTETDEEDPDPEFAFTEDDYLRRRPHNSFRQHWQCEKLVSKLQRKDKLDTYIFWSGVTYGEEEETYHDNFKRAWSLDPAGVHCYGPGENCIPMIHIKDLSKAVATIIENKPETRFYLAVDDGKPQQKEIWASLNSKLGTGQPVKHLNRDEMLLDPNTELFLVNLKFTAGAIKDLGFEWSCEAGMLENMDKVIDEYKKTRNLTALKVFIHGPPAAGKSFCAEKLAQHYNIAHIKLGDVIKAAIESETEVGEEAANAEKTPEGLFQDPLVIKMVKQRLMTKECLNRGFILDGYPKTIEQAAELFKPLPPGDDEEAPPEPEEGEAGNADIDFRIVPEFVISLSASDEYIQERVKALPQEEVDGTTWSEEKLTARLAKWRGNNVEDKTVLNWFSKNKIEYCDYEVSSEPQTLVDRLVVLLGIPHNYGPSKEEIAEKARVKAEEEAKKREAEMAEQRERERIEAEERERAVQQAAARLQQVEQQERELLAVKTLPLRNYLMENVMPTLMEALISVCKLKPEDPIDYVAEYLFKEDAPGKAEEN